MNRRDLLKFLLMSPLAAVTDYEKLLWVPGAKRIFIPAPILTESQIIAMEMERILPNIRTLFEIDSAFYEALYKRSIELVSSRQMRIPLQLKPTIRLAW